MALVKICGNTNLEDAEAAVSFGADYLGFIFTESKRRIRPEKAARIMAALPGFERFVGVFYNQPKKEVLAIAESLRLPYLQFHGDETSRYCESFMEEGYGVIKTFRIKDKLSLKRLDEYNVTSFLFDTYSKKEKGGTGIPFDWSLIEKKAYVRDRLFLAGGLNVHNLADAIKRVRPHAVDVASGVESSPGKKDHALLEEFIRIAKRGDKKHASKKALHR